MNAIELKESIVDIVQVGLVPMVTSVPGAGKSDIIKSIAKEYALELIDIRLSQVDPVEMMGFPYHNKERMSYVPPEHFPLEGLDTIPKGKSGYLLFLDEFNSASLSTQAAAYRLVLDRQIGKYNLHKNVAIICAGNRETDNAIVNRMSTAMQSRLVHLELDIDVKAWLAWASENSIDYRVISYIQSRPEHLSQFDPNHNDKTFANPRTWSFTSKLVKGKDTNPRMLQMLIGTISAGIAHEFNAHMSYCSELPTIDQITANPNSITIPDDPSLLYAMSHMVAAYIEDKNADKLMEYISRLPLEFGTTAIRSALKRNKELLKLPPVRSWANLVASEIF